MHIKSLIIIIISLLTTSVVSAENNSLPGDFNFLVFTDTHLDVYPKANPTIINPKPNTYNSGNIDEKAFNKLFDKITEENIANKTNPNFILTLGDINAHNASSHRGFRQKDLYTAFIKLGQTFPASPIFNTFGNNDSPATNYGAFSSNGESPYITLMNNAGWKDGFLSSGAYCSKQNLVFPCINVPDENNKKFGFYTAYLQKNLKLIALNSVLFSSESTAEHHGADEELAWLDSELQSSIQNNENVIISMHMWMGHGWLDRYNDQFTKIMYKMKPGVIIGMLASHAHLNSLRVVRLVNKKNATLDVFPLIIVPAIAPANNNAPGFKNFIMTKINDRWAIKDIVSYSFQQKESTDPISLIEYYKFIDSYCPNQNVTVSECLRMNLVYKNHTTIKSPASDLMSQHYTNGNLNNHEGANASSWIMRYTLGN